MLRWHYCQESWWSNRRGQTVRCRRPNNHPGDCRMASEAVGAKLEDFEHAGHAAAFDERTKAAAGKVLAELGHLITVCALVLEDLTEQDTGYYYQLKNSLDKAERLERSVKVGPGG